MKPTYDELWAAIQLAAVENVFFGKDYGPITPYVLCSDIFVYGADSEDVEWEELPELFKLYSEYVEYNSHYGKDPTMGWEPLADWVYQKRKENGEHVEYIPSVAEMVEPYYQWKQQREEIDEIL